MTRLENDPGLQNKSEPVYERRKKALLGRGAIIALESFAALIAGIWLMIVSYGLISGR